MFKALEKWLQRGTIKNLEEKERFLVMLQRHNTTVEGALQVIRMELEKERGHLCNILA